MEMMADPMIPLQGLQILLDEGLTIDPNELESGYKTYYDEPGGGRRFSFVKIMNEEVEALAIFGLENPIDGIVCWNVGYAVKENKRGKGLSIEAVNFGLEKLKSNMLINGIKRFYLEAIIDKTNINSLIVAKKIFSNPPSDVFDKESGKSALQFKKIIVMN